MTAAGTSDSDMAARMTHQVSTVSSDDAAVASCASGKYPSTPHLPFSPGVNDDDRIISGCLDFIKRPIIITEKVGLMCGARVRKVLGRSRTSN